MTELTDSATSTGPDPHTVIMIRAGDTIYVYGSVEPALACMLRLLGALQSFEARRLLRDHWGRIAVTLAVVAPHVVIQDRTVTTDLR